MHFIGKRRAGRLAVSLPVALLAGDRRSGGTILDISRNGARVRTPFDLSRGSVIVLMSDRLGALNARVMWCKDRVAGVEFANLSADVSARLRAMLLEIADRERHHAAVKARPQFGRRI